MNIEQLHAQADAEFGGPAFGALPAFSGDKVRPHKGGGSSGSTTTTQSIPTELKPLATAYASKAMDLSNQEYQPLDWKWRIAGLTDNQKSGMSALADRATNGSQTINNAEGQLNNIIGGSQTNPYLDQLVNKAQDSVRSQFNTGAVTSGSFGNSGLQEQFQKGLGDVATSMYGNAYNTDKAAQMQGIGMAQQFGNQAYTDADQLLKAGQIQQDQNQQLGDYWYQQYQDKQNLPYKQLAAMSGVFGSGIGGTSTSTQSGGGGK